MNVGNPKRPSRPTRAIPVMLIALSLAMSVTVCEAGDWKFTATPYAWATAVGVDASLNGAQVVSKDISVSDLVKELDTILQGRLELQYKELGLTTDLFDVTMSDEKRGVGLPQGAGSATFRPDMRMTLWDMAGLYDPNGDRRGVELLAGMRLLYLRAQVDASYSLTAGPVVDQSYESHETLIDGMAGVRFTQPLPRRFAIQAQADVSTGQTHYTWSMAPSLIYSFDDRGRWSLSGGYRYMKIDFEESNGLDSTMDLSGALLGFRMSF
jgi:hypothetical protein